MIFFKTTERTEVSQSYKLGHDAAVNQWCNVFLVGLLQGFHGLFLEKCIVWSNIQETFWSISSSKNILKCMFQLQPNLSKSSSSLQPMNHVNHSCTFLFRFIPFETITRCGTHKHSKYSRHAWVAVVLGTAATSSDLGNAQPLTFA